MAIQLECRCGKSLKAPNSFSGTRAECPFCGQKITIPGDSGATDTGIQFSEKSSEQKEIVTAKLAKAEKSQSVDPSLNVVTFLDPPTKAIADKQPRWMLLRRMMAAMLDPRSIQWMLSLGGGLMVIGIIVWLTSLGIFEEPRILAAFLISGSFGMLALGCFVVMQTKYKIAGQALTFLSCILVPMNLWFLHAQDLVTIDGNLWMGALVCCVLYVVVVYVLKDPLFLYAVEGGVTLTAVLFLANLGAASDPANLALMLLGLSLISIHAERFFKTDGESFTRRRFGLPLFWSGHVQLAAALLILLATQMVDWLSINLEYTFLRGFAADDNLLTSSSWLAGVMWLGATYTYLYSDFVVRRVGVYLYLAAISMIFAAVSIIGLNLGGEGAIVVLAVASLVVNLGQRFVGDKDERITRALPPLAQLLSVPPVLIAIALHVRATSEMVGSHWAYDTSWMFVGASLIVAICHRVSAHLLERHNVRLAWNYMFMSAAAAMVAAAGLLRSMDVVDWPTQACLLMLLPLGYLIAGRLWRGHFPERPLGAVAHAGTAVILVHVFFGTLADSGQYFISRSTGNLLLGTVFAEAAVFYALAGLFRRKSVNVYFAAASACGAFWQFMCYFDVDGAYYSLIYAVLGTVLLVTARTLGLEWTDKYLANGSGVKRLDGRGLTAFKSANAILSVAFVVAFCSSVARLQLDIIQWIPFAAHVVTLMLCIAAVWIVPGGYWRRFYACCAVGMTGTIVLTFTKHLTPFQTIEILFVIVGLVMLVASYIGRFLETSEGENDSVSMGLWMGSGLSALTLLVAVLYYRFVSDSGPSMIDEFALLTVSILMLVTGYSWQFKGPTLIGGFTATVYLFVLMVTLAYQPQVAIGVYLAVGGGLLFAIGVALSIYRERLIELSEQFARREGVFQVINWR